VALSGCISSITGGGGGGSETLTVALMFPQSGSYAVYGEDGRKAVRLAREQLNEAGDGPEIETVTKDTELSPEAAVQRAREAVQSDNADVLLGFTSSSVALAVSEFGSGQDVVTVATVAQTPQLTGEQCRRKTFRTAGDLVQNNRGAALSVQELTDVSSDWTMSSIYPDYVFGQETWRTFRDTMQNSVGGMEVGTAEAPAFGKGEYQNEIQALLDSDPDIVYSSLSGSDLIAFIRQGQQVGFFEEIEEFVHASGAITDTSRALGDDMVEMIAVDRYFYRFPDTQRNNDFVEAYRDMHGEIPVNTAQETYAGMYGVHQAATEEGGTDVDSLVNGLEGLEIDAPEGTKTIRAEDHQSIEENIWCGRIGPVDYADFYGFTEMNETPGSEVIPEPDCDM
jgi:branched-chain amino acid transport system substrate-binding protein